MLALSPIVMQRGHDALEMSVGRLWVRGAGDKIEQEARS